MGITIGTDDRRVFRAHEVAPQIDQTDGGDTASLPATIAEEVSVDGPAYGRPGGDGAELRTRNLTETNGPNFLAFQLQNDMDQTLGETESGSDSESTTTTTTTPPPSTTTTTTTVPESPPPARPDDTTTTTTAPDTTTTTVPDGPPTGTTQGGPYEPSLADQIESAENELFAISQDPTPGASFGDVQNPATGEPYTADEAAEAIERASWRQPPTELSLSDPNFWEEAEPGVYSDGDLTYVVLDGDTPMQPFVRDEEEHFSSTAAAANVEHPVVINGNQYGVSNGGKADARIGNDPVDPSATTPEGHVVVDGQTVAGTSEPERFYLAYDDAGGYSFGQGNPPDGVDDAVGGLGPIIIDGLVYGDGNEYADGVPDGAPDEGEPGAAYAPYLTQRNNNTYAAVAGLPDSSGKTIFASSSEQDRVIVISQPNGVDGASFDEIRDDLVALGIDNAVFFDGSDSSYLRTGGYTRVANGENKNETNTVGVAFG